MLVVRTCCPMTRHLIVPDDALQVDWLAVCLAANCISEGICREKRIIGGYKDSCRPCWSQKTDKGVRR